jgi:hypothetical protein
MAARAHVLMKIHVLGCGHFSFTMFGATDFKAAVLIHERTRRAAAS